MFRIIVYGYLCGIRSSRKLEEACRYRVDFMWLLEDQEAPDHAVIARFRTGRIPGVGRLCMLSPREQEPVHL